MALPVDLGQCLVEFTTELHVQLVTLDHVLSECSEELFFLDRIDTVQEEAVVHDDVTSSTSTGGAAGLVDEDSHVVLVGTVTNEELGSVGGLFLVVLGDGILTKVRSEHLHPPGGEVFAVTSIPAPKFDDRGRPVDLCGHQDTELRRDGGNRRDLGVECLPILLLGGYILVGWVLDYCFCATGHSFVLCVVCAVCFVLCAV
mmetsp:Transcript_24536/g.58220  ORF Transcript_24536/g.58220 Transcript_24536/m.58220 type:complete len:201 (+) Transcript_24536:366-968(+)